MSEVGAKRDRMNLYDLLTDELEGREQKKIDVSWGLDEEQVLIIEEENWDVLEKKS